MVEKIEYNGQTFALIVRSNYEPEGVNFITSQENPIQLGILKHPHGTEIKAHIHKKFPRDINEAQEVLHIVYGKLEVEFYEDSDAKIGSTILNSGDTILLISGGHGFNVMEDTKIIEVKQGPYHGVEEDKQRI